MSTVSSTQNMRVAAGLDVGTNSVKCVVLELTESGGVHVLFDDRFTTRLGENLTASGRLSETAMQRSAEAVERFVEVSKSMGASDICAAGTSALREAVNGNDFLRKVQERTGVRVAVLSGDEEARMAFEGVRDLSSSGSCVMVDMGGGSTEWVVGQEGHIAYHHSFPVGAIRLTETHLTSDPPRPSEVDGARQHIEQCFRGLPAIDAKFVIAVGGGFYALASVACAHRNTGTPDGCLLDREELDRQLGLYLRSGTDIRQEIPGLPADRAAIIPAGTLIARACLEGSQADALRVTLRGLRHGLAMSLFR